MRSLRHSVEARLAGTRKERFTFSLPLVDWPAPGSSMSKFLTWSLQSDLISAIATVDSNREDEAAVERSGSSVLSGTIRHVSTVEVSQNDARVSAKERKKG